MFIRGFKAATLEEQLPILAVERDFIISKYADITAVYKVDWPSIYTTSYSETKAIHELQVKVFDRLPCYSVWCQQDWFIKETYRAAVTEDMSFLERASRQHFDNRTYLAHYSYFFITKTSPDRLKATSLYSALVRGSSLPKDVNEQSIEEFEDVLGQIEAMINESRLFSVQRLTTEEIVGSKDESGKERAGLLEKYLSVSTADQPCLEDIDFRNGLQIGHKHFSLFTLSNLDDLPDVVATDNECTELSTSSTRFSIGYTAPVGMLLDCNHIYTQYMFKDDATATLKELEGTAKNLHSLSRYSRENALNCERTQGFLQEAHEMHKKPVRAHCNLLVWTEDKKELPELKNKASCAISSMNCKPRHNTTDIAGLYWAGIPGNAGDFPAEETFLSFPNQAFCLFNCETGYKGTKREFGLRLVNKFGVPVRLDLSDEPMEKKLIDNRNKFIFGPSGSGKSFFTNHMVRQYFEQGAHVVLVDIGHSYLGLCNIIRELTGGKHGLYITHSDKKPICIAPFASETGEYDSDKKNSILVLLLTLWKKYQDDSTRAEDVALRNAITAYINKFKATGEKPSFDGFYEFVRDEYRETLKKDRVREKDFDLHNFLYVLSPYYKGGEYDYLLNATEEMNLLSNRFIVFELEAIKDHNILLPVVTLTIMETFISKISKLPLETRKMILVEECWKAIANDDFAEYLKYLYKTVRKYCGEAIIVTQELDDVIHNPIVRLSIINNADCKILLDQNKYKDRFDEIRQVLSMSEKEATQALALNLNNDRRRRYKEVFISLKGHSAIYGVEVSPQEYFTYTTEAPEKAMVLAEYEKCGSYQMAVETIASRKTA